MKNFLLYIAAVLILIYINFYNRKVVKKKGSINGYDRSQAMSIDSFAGENYRSIWNLCLINKDNAKVIFGQNDGEMMSSVLGKNLVDNNLTNLPNKDFPNWLTGIKLVKILDKIFNEKNHCVNSIDLKKGSWKYPENYKNK
jgi:hypothetical protein